MFMVGMAYWTSGRLEFTFMPKVTTGSRFKRDFPTACPLTKHENFSTASSAQRLKCLKKQESQMQPWEPTPRLAPVRREMVQSRPGELLGGHACSVTIRMSAIDERSISVREFTEKWREKVGKPPLSSPDFKYSMGPGAGPDITLQLAHPDAAVLKQAGEELAAN